MGVFAVVCLKLGRYTRREVVFLSKTIKDTAVVGYLFACCSEVALRALKDQEVAIRQAIHSLQMGGSMASRGWKRVARSREQQLRWIKTRIDPNKPWSPFCDLLAGINFDNQLQAKICDASPESRWVGVGGCVSGLQKNWQMCQFFDLKEKRFRRPKR